jgi:hypothetical protein
VVARTTASKKAKARELQKEVASDIRAKFHLPEEDVLSKPMGSGGVDVIMSRAALDKFPFAIECKSQEKLNIWDAFEQCKDNAVVAKQTPLLVFKRNRSELMIAMRWEDFLNLFGST